MERPKSSRQFQSCVLPWHQLQHPLKQRRSLKDVRVAPKVMASSRAHMQYWPARELNRRSICPHHHSCFSPAVICLKPADCLVQFLEHPDSDRDPDINPDVRHEEDDADYNPDLPARAGDVFEAADGEGPSGDADTRSAAAPALSSILRTVGTTSRLWLARRTESAAPARRLAHGLFHTWCDAFQCAAKPSTVSATPQPAAAQHDPLNVVGATLGSGGRATTAIHKISARFTVFA